MALFYAIFEKIFFDDERQFGYLLKISMQNTALVLLLPYSAMWLYFSYREKKQQLEQMVIGDGFPDLSKNLVPFHDEKGILRLSVKKDHLLYLESSDNYVNIYYQNKDKITKFLLRNTMKKMEEIFQNSEIIRCHRCFMVNFEKVKVLRKDKEGLQLELDLPTNVDIPVSRSYIEKVMVTFSKYSANY
jgi:DNA-binding LytR/AlgR family response regulator